MDKGSDISNRYQVFTRGNLLYRDRRDFFPEEPFRYCERPFPVDDARTIVSVLSNLNSVKGSYESGSVDNLARLVSERASIGLNDRSHGLAPPAASHTGTMKVDAPTLETSWEPELDILDPSLLRRHIVPRLGGNKAQERLGESLGQAIDVLTQEARDRMKLELHRRAFNIEDLAKVYSVLQAAVGGDDQSSHGSESLTDATKPPGTTPIGSKCLSTAPGTA